MNKRFKVILATICIAACLVSSVVAQSSAELDHHLSFKEANELLGNGESIETALSNYLQISENRGASVNLYINIASCYFKLNQLGLSRLYLERAFQMNPNNPETNNNLKVLLEKLDFEEPQASFWESAVKRLSSNQWYGLSLILLITPMTIFLILRLIRYRNIRALKFPIILTFAIGGFCLFLSVCAAKYSHYGVTTSKEGQMLISPFEKSELVANVSEGRKLRILKHLQGYYLCADNLSGVKGWISEDSFEAIIGDSTKIASNDKIDR